MVVFGGSGARGGGTSTEKERAAGVASRFPTAYLALTLESGARGPNSESGVASRASGIHYV